MQMDLAGEKNPQSQPVLEFWAALYNELNRESKYFEILTKLVRCVRPGRKYSESLGSAGKTCGYRPLRSAQPGTAGNAAQPRGRFVVQTDCGRLARSTSLSAGSPVDAAPSDAGEIVSASQADNEAGREKQTLEDLIVQTEIFLQYSLHNKALDRLQKIGVMFPGEEKRNARLSNLYQLANWWPPGAHRQQPGGAPAGTGAPAPPPTPMATAPVAPVPHSGIAGSGGAGKSGVYTAETLRDLSKISEVNQKIFRQQTPRAMLNTAVNEVGTYLHATRSLAVVGAAGVHRN